MAFNVQYIIEAIDRFSPILRKANEGFSKSQKQFSKMAQDQQKAMSQPMDAVRKASQAAASAMVLALPIKKAMAFEDAMADVKKVVNFSDPTTGAKKMGDQLKEMSRTIPLSVEGLAQMAAAGGQLGLAEGDITGFVEQSAKMAVAFDMLPAEAGQAMATLSNVLNVPISKISEVGDTINYLGNNMAATSRQITNATLRFAALGKSAGFNNDQIAALTATVISFGREPEQAATGLNSIIQRLQTIQFQSPKVKNMFKGIGLDAKQFSTMMKKDAAGAFVMLLEKMKGIDSTKRAGIIQAVFGAGIDAQIFEQLTSGLDKLKTSFALVSDKAKMAGSMEKEFTSRSKTTSNALQLAKNAIMEAAVNLGTILLPYVAQAAQMFAAVTHIIVKYTNAHPELTKAIIMATAAMAGFIATTKLLELGKIILGISNLSNMFEKLTKTVKLNPLIAIAGAIAYLVAQTEGGRQSLGAFMDLFQATFLSVANLVTGIVNAFSSLFGGTEIKEGVKSISDVFGFLAKQINMVIDAMVALGMISQEQVKLMRMSSEEKNYYSDQAKMLGVNEKQYLSDVANNKIGFASHQSSQYINDLMKTNPEKYAELQKQAKEAKFSSVSGYLIRGFEQDKMLKEASANQGTLNNAIIKPSVLNTQNKNMIEVSLKAAPGTEVTGVKSKVEGNTTVKLGKGGGQNMPAASY